MEKMRLVVLVDMPASTRHERKVAREYAESLFRQGYARLQEGVYTRLADGRSSAEAFARRLEGLCPEFGDVRLLMLTERQFQRSVVLLGRDDAQEQEVGSVLDIFL